MTSNLTRRILEDGRVRSSMKRLGRLLLGSSDEKSGGEHFVKECDVRRDAHVPGNVTREYGADKSGTVLYQFNSRGYRSEEYDPSAKVRICVIGESNSVGVGIRLEDTFGYKLKQHIATSLQIGVDEVNLINFSVAGASADYCVRTLYRQLSDCDVEFLVFQLPSRNQIEYTDGKTFRSYVANTAAVKSKRNAPIPLLAFCDFYNEHLGASNLLKNTLLAQAFLKERKIDYVLATQYLPRTNDRYDYLKDYFDQLDMDAVLLHQYFAIKADLAADGTHAGPRCHAAFAIELLSFFGRMQLERGNENRGRRIHSHASHLRNTDEDWKYCNAAIANLMAKGGGTKG